MVWILLVLPLAVKMLQSEWQTPEKTVTKTSTELAPSSAKYEPIHEIKDTNPTSDSLQLMSTELGKS